MKGIDSKFWSYAFFLNQLSIKILKMKIRLVFLLFLIINQTISYAQIIKGTVFDKITNESLEGASVYLDGTTIGVITNSEGKFEIEDGGTSKDILQKMWILRNHLADMNSEEAMNLLLKQMKGTRDNYEFLTTMNK